MGNVNTPKVGDGKLESILKQLSTDEKARLLEMLQHDKESSNEAILKDLKKNYITKEDAEMMGYKGKKVHINLPAVSRNFGGFKFDFFISDDPVHKDEIESNHELEKKLYSTKEIGELLNAMNGYLESMGVVTDENIDYENDLKSWRTAILNCTSGNYLKDSADLDSRYWLSDNNISGKEGLSVEWDCHGNLCRFFCSEPGRTIIQAYLFLKLS